MSEEGDKYDFMDEDYYDFMNDQDVSEMQADELDERIQKLEHENRQLHEALYNIEACIRRLFGGPCPPSNTEDAND